MLDLNQRHEEAVGAVDYLAEALGLAQGAKELGERVHSLKEAIKKTPYKHEHYPNLPLFQFLSAIEKRTQKIEHLLSHISQPDLKNDGTLNAFDYFTAGDIEELTVLVPQFQKDLSDVTRIEQILLKSLTSPGIKRVLGDFEVTHYPGDGGTRDGMRNITPTNGAS